MVDIVDEYRRYCEDFIEELEDEGELMLAEEIRRLAAADDETALVVENYARLRRMREEYRVNAYREYHLHNALKVSQLNAPSDSEKNKK